MRSHLFSLKKLLTILFGMTLVVGLAPAVTAAPGDTVTITGTVVTVDGDPAEGAKVILYEMNLVGSTKTPQNPVTQVADENGEYSHQAEEGQEYTVRVQHEGQLTHLGGKTSIFSADTFFPEDLPDGKVPTITAAKVYQITGTVISPRGIYSGTDRIQLTQLVMGSTGSLVPGTTSEQTMNGDGQYTFTARHGELYTVRLVYLRHPFYHLGDTYDLRDAVTFRPEELPDKDVGVIHTKEMRDLNATVVDQHGFAVPGVNIATLMPDPLTGKVDKYWLYNMWTSGSDGSVSPLVFHGVEHKLAAYLDGKSFETDSFTVTGDDLEFVAKLNGYTSPQAEVLGADLKANLKANLDGKARVGTKIRVKHDKAPAGYTVKRQWLLDGKAIKGETKTTLTPKRTWHKKRISAKVTYQLSDVTALGRTIAFEPITTVTTKTATVAVGQTSTKLSVKAKKKAKGKKKNGTAQVRLSVKLPGTKASSVKGKATIYVGKKKVKTVKVKKGKAKYTVKKLKAGKHKIKVVYTPPKGYKKVTKSKNVRIKKRK